jgi:PAS domain S-box-containing protein
MVGEISDYAILFINEKGIIENWNKGAEKIKGYKAEEIIGKNFSIFYTEKDRNAGLAEQLINQARISGKANHEGWRIRKDGSAFWGNVSITSLRDLEGNLLGFSKVTRDLTQKKIADDNIARQTEILKQKNIDLENMNRELQSFAYVSSHDLQEPLRKIRTFSDRIIEMDYKHLSEKGRDMFNRMNEAAKRMQNLIEDLLEYARTNVTERKFEIISLQEIINEVKMDLKESIESKNIRIIYNGDCQLNVIHFQFRQLFHNLFTNSIKFGRPGIICQINVSCTSERGISFNNPELIPGRMYKHIIVSDNGIGFEKQYNNRIFDVFQRLHGKHEFKGTGIGLAICKKIIENHHGIIIATGQPDVGATFSIFIPDDQV